MPRDYEEYLRSSLCQNEGDGSPKIASVLAVEISGFGVSVKLKVRPHVRWTKLLAKWSACFDAPPLAWPVTIGLQTPITLTSIQDSVSRSIGPDLLEQLVDGGGVLEVFVGDRVGVGGVSGVGGVGGVGGVSGLHASNGVEIPIASGVGAACGLRASNGVEIPTASTAVPPISHPEDSRGASAVPLEEILNRTEENLGGNSALPHPHPDPTEENLGGNSALPHPYSVKLRIECAGRKTLKMNVSGRCSVERLIGKWAKAARMDDDGGRAAEMKFGEAVLDRRKLVQEVLPDGGVVRVCITFPPQKGQIVEETFSTPKRQRTALREATTRAPIEGPQSSSLSSQRNELLYWEQVREAGGEEDEDLAFAIALSLSEQN